MPHFCHPADSLSPFVQKRSFICKHIFLQKRRQPASFCITKPKLYNLLMVLDFFLV